MSLSISSYISQIIAGQGRKPGPIHDALQAIQNWASAGLTTSDLAAAAGILASQTALGGTFTPWTSYTPSWTNTGTANSLGNGVITGKYMQAGTFTICNVTLTFGSTTSGGNGNWLFSLPSGVPTASGGSVFCIMEALDTSAATYFPGTGKPVSTTTFNGIAVGGLLANGVPFVWANGDALDITIVYQQ